MKLIDGLVINSMGDEYVVMAPGSDVFKGVIRLNQTGAFLFDAMKKEFTREKLADMLTKEYDVDFDTAVADSNKILDLFIESGLVDVD